jgi:HSP20 family protein
MLFDTNPLTELQRMQRELDAAFSGASLRATFPLVNVYDEAEEIVIEAELPGMAGSDIKITFSNGALTLSGDRKQPDSYKNMSVARSERSIGKFEKVFRIPTEVDPGKISASFSNGVLTITLSKAEEAKPRQISVEAR